MDIGRSFTIKAPLNQAKFDALEHYQTSPLFTEAERAALDYVTEFIQTCSATSLANTSTDVTR
jgi:alkylhydroperoxidase family enzyme